MNKVQMMCKQAVVAAMYVALCFVNPMSFGTLQFRVANMLVALPLIKREYAPGVLLGIAIANSTSPLGIYDVAFGLAAEGIAYALTVWGPCKHAPFAAKAAIVSVCVAAVIGLELNMVYSAPYAVTAAGLGITTMAAIMIGYMVFAKSPMKKII